MSFIGGGKGQGYEPGYFLAHEECTRETRQFSENDPKVKTTVAGGKYVPMGTIYPANDGTAIGITYEDVDVTNGDMPGSVVTAGTIVEAKLPETLAGTAKTALQGLGFKFVTEDTVTRPY